MIFARPPTQISVHGTHLLDALPVELSGQTHTTAPRRRSVIVGAANKPTFFAGTNVCSPSSRNQLVLLLLLLLVAGEKVHPPFAQSPPLRELKNLTYPYDSLAQMSLRRHRPRFKYLDRAIKKLGTSRHVRTCIPLEIAVKEGYKRQRAKLDSSFFPRELFNLCALCLCERERQK